MDPINYANILAAGQGLVPDYAAQEARKRLLGIQEGQLDLQRSGETRETAALGFKIGQERQKQADAAGFQTEMDAVLTSPSTEAYARLIAKYPAFTDQAKAAWGALDGERRNADLSQMGQIYAGVANGRPDLAAQVLERRIAADKAVDGTADPQDEAILAALKSGDAAQIKAAQGMIGVMLSAQTGPEHFGATLGRLTPEKKLRGVSAGEVVIDEATGQPVYASPYKPQLLKVQNGDGSESVLEYTPEQGGGGTTQPTGDVAAFVRSEGGTPTSGTRSAAKNAEVGGVPNSAHLTGDALDSVPPPGVSMAAWKSKLEAKFPDVEWINEGDHVHGERRGSGIGKGVGGKGGVRVVARSEGKKESVKVSATRVVGGRVYVKVGGRWMARKG